MGMKDVGSETDPINLGRGVLAFKRGGRWKYRGPKGREFITATDAELISELEDRGLSVNYPAHECVDRPNLPCPACERDAKMRSLLKIG